MNEEGIRKLAELSRLELTSEEISEYAGEFSSILEYVDSLKNAVSNSNGEELILENSANRNILREDENPQEPGLNTEKLIKSTSNSHENYIKVKKVL